MYRTSDNKIDTLYLQWLKDKGILAKLYRYGYIGHRLSTTLEVRLKVNALMRSGKSHGGATRIVAREFGVSRQYIYAMYL